MYKLNRLEQVVRISDGACIPGDERNKDYREYLEWISLGNQAGPYVEPEVSYKEKRKLEYPSAEEIVGAIMDSGLINFDHFSELKEIQEKRLDIKGKYPKGE